jgi:ABC-2 type transport system ATP-binding protein
MGSVEELCDYITLINKSRSILEGAVHDIKMKNKNNTFEIGYKGDPQEMMNKLDGHCHIVEQVEDKEGHHIKVKLEENLNGNELLARILPSVIITSFNELIPSVNEIFIRVVQAQNNQNSK